jgi:hypothetical protein
VSADGAWRVSTISLDGQPLFRVEHDGSTGIPLHSDGRHSATVSTGRGWYLAADVRTIREVARFVDLADLSATTETTEQG